MHQKLVANFPDNEYVQRLTQAAKQLGISFSPSPIEEQWLYHPDKRVIYVWEPDLTNESLSYIVVILAHELGHAIDFDTNQDHYDRSRGLHWADVPTEIEVAAFVHGFNLLKQLWIPVSLDQYAMMIDPSIASTVRREIETFHSCCLLSSASPIYTAHTDSSEAAS